MRTLHGVYVEIVKDPTVFVTTDGLADYVREHGDGFVYAVADVPFCIAAALARLRFGVFVHHPAQRDGSCTLAGVYHIGHGSISRVWFNPNPASDQGEALTSAFPTSY